MMSRSRLGMALALIILAMPLYLDLETVKLSTRLGVASSWTNLNSAGVRCNSTVAASTSSSIPTFCRDTSRCTSIDRTRRISFTHISKSGGASWIDELHKTEPLNDVWPEKETGDEFSVVRQNREDKFDHLSVHMVSLRSPRHHAWSLWSECRFDEWGIKITDQTEFPRAGEDAGGDVRDFTTWMAHFVDPVTHAIRSDQSDYYKCYHPSNYQSRALASDIDHPHGLDGRIAKYLIPDVTVANQTYWYMDWVAVTEFYHESKCLLYHRMEPKSSMMQAYLDDTCHCNDQQPSQYSKRSRVRARKTAAATTAAKTKSNINTTATGDVQNLHHDGRRRKTMRDLDPSLLASIAAATTTDVPIYVTALTQFMREMKWLESSLGLGRRVVCDGILNKWEDELTYLGVSVTELYATATEEY